MSRQLLFSTLSFLFIVLGSFSLKASHYSSGGLFYEWIGDEPGEGPNCYRIYATIYRNVGGVTIGTGDLNACYFKESNRSNATNFTLYYVDPSQSLPPNSKMKPGDPYGWRDNGPHSQDPDGWAIGSIPCASTSLVVSEYRYTGKVCLPEKAPDWAFAISSPCCRDTNDNLAAGGSFYLEVTLNNQLGPNSSPRFTAPLQYKFCIKSSSENPFHLALAPVEENTDSLAASFDQDGSQKGASCGNPSQLSYNTPYTTTNPFPANSLKINRSQGVFSFRPSMVGTYVTKFEMREFRYDSTLAQMVLVGNTIREISLSFSGSCDTTATQSPEICAVTFDPKDKRSKVFMRENSIDDLDSLYLFSGSSLDVFEADSLNSGIITDTVNPGIGAPAKKYSVAGFKECGLYSDTSQAHQNIVVNASININDSVRLSWVPYQGDSIVRYQIYSADSNFTNITLLDSVANFKTSHIITNADSNARFYMVEGILDDPSCLPSGFNYDGPLGATRLKGIGIEERSIPEVAIYPNPTHGTVKIEVEQLYQEEVYDYKILNSTGQAVLKGSLKSGTTELNISNLPDGLYFLNFEGRDGAEPILKN